MNAKFRLRKYFLYLGVVGTILFSFAACVSAIPFFLANPAAHGFKGPHSVAIVGGSGVVVFGAFTILGLYILAAYCIAYVSITDLLICIKSVFTTKQFDSSSVKRMEWNARALGGKVILHLLNSRAKIEFHEFSSKDSLEIIRTLRQMASDERQQGWPSFCHHVALPLREGRRPRQPGAVRIDLETLPESDRVFVTRRRYDIFFSILLVLSTFGSLAVWWASGNPEGIRLLVNIPFFWALLRFSTPKEGRWSARWTATKEQRLAGLVHLALPVMCLAAIALGFIGINPKLAFTIGIAFMVAACAIFLYHATKREKEQRAKDLAESAESVVAWELGESST